MRVPPRLIAVVSFVVVGMLALVVAGMLDWIVGVLFLTMEFLGEAIRGVFRRRGDRRPPPSRDRHVLAVPPHVGRHRRGFVRRERRLRRKRAGDQTPSIPPGPRLRLLVPVCGDEPDLLAFALEECRSRQAELLLLFLRPIAVIPMGPNPLPGLSEDDEARATFDRIGSEANRVGVPLRTIYATTGDRPATIAEVARACEVDLVVVRSTRGNRISKLLARDLIPSLLRVLPERASLMIRAS